jgi:predicted enzyme related to lactoylglutathione lyase
VIARMLIPAFRTRSEQLRICVSDRVEDIEAERDRLLSLGAAVQETERLEGVIAFCDFVDPDRNRLSIHQVLG